VKAAVSRVAIGMVIAGASAPPARAAGRLRVHKAHQGDVRAVLSYREGPPNRFWYGARLRIWNAGKLVVNRRLGTYVTWPGRNPLRVLQLDGAGPAEVLVTLYTGGTHCCSESWVYTGTHRTVMGWGHIDAAKLRDADGDGKPEFHWYDTSWAYFSGVFADSAFPVKVWSYSENAFHDVTRSFPAEVQADQARQYGFYREAVDAGNAGRVRTTLAAYAADGYMLGQGDAAMAVVQAAIDAGETNDADFTGNDYLDTLRKALVERGYTS
jgi:hypothetical protein